MDKKFIEEYPLFRKFKTKVPSFINQLKTPPINMECKTCKSSQTFNSIILVDNLNRPIPSSSKNKKITLIYLCQSCKTFKRHFNIFISKNLDYYYKFGQYPEWEIAVDKNLEKTFGEHLHYYRKGLVCESQGYGIGAYSYYRRITEEIIDQLLDSITDLIEPENQKIYLKALAETKKTRVTQEKIDLVKDLLPPILKPNNMNPLGILHSELSEGLHSQSDEVCLESAIHIKNILIFFVKQIIQSRKASTDFTSGMKALLDKKSKRKSKED